jgi:membrane-associated protease RseP (regulator of RpoE activity)
MTVKLIYGGECLVDSLTGQEGEVKDAGGRRVEFSFPILTVRTQMFAGVFDRLGGLRGSRLVSWVALAIVPVVAGVGLFMVCGSLFALLWNPAVGEAARELGPGAYLLLPGVNPVLPLVYGWFAIVCAIAVHEGAHGVIARNLGLKVKSSGLLFFLFIPIGAFVDVDEEQLKKASAKVSSRVLAAGVGGNITVAAVCLIGLLVIVGGLTPVIDGVYVYEVVQGMPAEAAGLLPNDVLVSVDNVRINSTADLSALLANKTLGDVVQVTVDRGEKWQNRFSTVVNLTVSENRTVMGVSVGDLLTEERLKNYQASTIDKLSIYLVPPALASGLVPFSDSLASFYTSWLGPQWSVLANGLFWLWFVNVNVAVFNALPIYPLDGGRMFNVALKSAIKRKGREKLISRITVAVTAALVFALLMLVLIPFIT